MQVYTSLQRDNHASNPPLQKIVYKLTIINQIFKYINIIS